MKKKVAAVLLVVVVACFLYAKNTATFYQIVEVYDGDTIAIRMGAE